MKKVPYNAEMKERAVSGISIVFLALVIALFQALANEYYLYWEWWWADIVMHFLGGLLIASGVLWWLHFEIPVGLRSQVPKFLTALLAIIVVGVAWEVFEYVTGMYNAVNYTLDVTLDLVTNVGGMLFAYLLFKKYAR